MPCPNPVSVQASLAPRAHRCPAAVDRQLRARALQRVGAGLLARPHDAAVRLSSRAWQIEVIAVEEDRVARLQQDACQYIQRLLRASDNYDLIRAAVDAT